MTFSTERGCCEWCEAKDNLLQGTTGDGRKLLICKDGYARGKRWPDVWPAGRVGVPDRQAVHPEAGGYAIPEDISDEELREFGEVGRVGAYEGSVGR
jgi:hypothetical protein